MSEFAKQQTTMSNSNETLDCHRCPKCDWSFLNRLPRTLDCKHSFYFCENCLKRKERVQCGICSKVTIIKQIVSPRSISNKSYKAGSFSFTMSSEDDPDAASSNILQFATLPTKMGNDAFTPRSAHPRHQCESFHRLFTSPLKHYKHHANQANAKGLFPSHPSSEPLKTNQPTLPVSNGAADYDDIMNIVDLQKQIFGLKMELQSKDASEAVTADNTQNEIYFMKQQIVELLISKEKLTNANDDLSEEVNELKATNMSLMQENLLKDAESNKSKSAESVQTQSHISKLSELRPIREKCRALANEVRAYKHSLHEQSDILSNFVTDEMARLSRMSLTVSASQRQIVSEYNKEVTLRRRYFNEIQELKGNIRVFCRVRPLLSDELEKHFTMKVRSVDRYRVCIERAAETDRNTDYKRTFEFDRVFSTAATQNEVFGETEELITSVLDGFNVCLFAYGQTGSGKTYTMEGINERAVRRLFETMDERRANYNYTNCVCSLYEIYNEKIRDLLIEKDNKSDRPNLKIRSDEKTGVHITNLTRLNCAEIGDVFRALEMGYQNRSRGVTDMNKHSSRSHCIFTINVEGVHRSTRTRTASKLHLIDLAGSERIKTSGATGDRLKECQAINRSLSCLGNVLEAIRAKKQHIPYRDSKLTFLLRDSIGKQAKTLMFVNVSSCSKDVGQTMISLLFADRVRNVELGQSKQNAFKASPLKKRRSSISALSASKSMLM